MNSWPCEDVGRRNSTLGNKLECNGSLCKDLHGSFSLVPAVSPTRPQENVTSSSTQSGQLRDSAAGSPNKAPDEEEVLCDPKFGGGEPGAHQSPTGDQNMKQDQRERSCDPKSGLCKIDDDQEISQTASLLKFSGDVAKNDEKENPMQKSKPLCDTWEPRFDLCDMAGEVRILGNSSSVLFVDVDPSRPAANESWRIRPYARKGDNAALEHVRQVLVSSLPAQGGAAACAVHHDVPAIVFSISGYTGNFFHDFTDVLVPLFLTSRPFNGEVQFLITDYKWWWVNKYRLILEQLTRYDIIDFDKEHKVHCYPRAVVGLRRHKELSIDPSKPPQGFSMVEFARFMRTAFSLERDTVTRAGSGRKPRLMIISRKRTRSLVNVGKVVQMAQKVGFEVVVGEMGFSSDVASFARLVNSCDVLMGVHGAGLTNLIFLPTNGTLIQIVPWGGLEWISNLDFGQPAVDAHLTYLQYTIKAEESTLIQQYPRDHPVFKNPFSIHRQGWDALRSIFLDKQNVRLDVKRFRSLLQQVLSNLLRQ
ncbi:hypothetical protein Taro_046661 [Colocasia esculenta]|uniref:Glycosyltransferase 61 catalytic domain-containing protein n=1 Tax=Colocasia esculenta TaxID=4460 RepID=A0A843X5V0_COLES|nr:hypothetical protein [Colocasia esculenta]